MQLIIVAGPPSVGKTAVTTHVARLWRAKGARVLAAKFDTQSSADPERYRQNLGAPSLGGLSGYLCPDHYFISNLEEVVEWGHGQRADVLFVETAGLCLRCAPHVEGVPAVTVIDALGGLDAPVKVGPMLSLADVVVLTKGDLVSQAEREVLMLGVRRINPTALVLPVNGLTGTGGLLLLRWLMGQPAVDQVGERSLRHDMPASICSYCTGERRVGRAYQTGNVEKIAWEAVEPCA